MIDMTKKKVTEAVTTVTITKMIENGKKKNRRKPHS